MLGESLLEREFELRAVRRSLADLTDGVGSVLVLDAPAGLGKTTLVRLARDEARDRGFTVLSARGGLHEADFGYGVVRQLFEPVLPQAGPDRQRLLTGPAHAAGGLFGAAAGEADRLASQGSQSELFNGLYWLLLGLGGTRPVVVVVDDMQWADAPSVRFLGFLARRAEATALTLIVCARSSRRQHDESLDEILGAPESRLLQPRELSPAAVAQLVRREFGRDGDEEFCAACHAVTGGSPLFLRELLRTLVDRGVRPEADFVPAARAAGPDAVRRYVLAALRRRSAIAHSVADAVAVLGDGTDLTFVAMQCDQSLAATAAAAEQLARDGVFERADPPAFVRGAVRDVVLSLTPSGARDARHERAAAVLAQAGQPAEAVAAQLLRTTPAGRQDRVAVLLAAAEQAKLRGAPTRAVAFLRRAQSEPPSREQWSDVSRLIGVCQAHRLDLADAEWHLRQAVALADTPLQRGLGVFSLARFRGACGAPGEAVDLLGQALRDLADDGGEPAAPSLVGRLQAELIGAARANLGRRADLLEHLAAYERRPDASEMVVVAQHAVEELFAGAPADRVAELARKALAAGPLPPDCAMLWAPVHALMVTDRLAEAENCLNQALDFSVHRAAAFSAALLEGQLARLSWLRGDLAAARVHLAAAAEGLTTPDGTPPVLQPVAVDLLLADERYEEADAALRASALSGPRAPETVWEMWLLDARIRLNIARGEYGAVYADAMLCRRAYTAWGAEQLLEVPWRLYAAHAGRHLGKPDRAAELVDEHLSLARAFGAPRYIAAALRAAASLRGAPAEAEGLLREAVEMLEVGPARLELVRTLDRLGTVLALRGDRPGAVVVRGRAARLAERCDAAPLAQRLRALTVPEPAPAAPPQLIGVDAFTPAERQVTALVIKGLTNRQVARRLFLSEKTVEAHLSRAYRKAGVRSRTQLTARLSATSAG